MKFFSADDYGAYGRAKEETTRGEASRFFALAQADAAARERAIASANEADRFAFQAAVQDARAMEDRNRFDLQQAIQNRNYGDQRSDVEFNRSLMLSQEDRAKDQAKLRREESVFNRKLAEDDARLMGLEDESIGASIAGSLAAAEESLNAQQAAFKRAQDALTQSKGKLAAAGFTFRGDNFVRPNLDPLLPEAEKKKLAEARAALEQNYFDAVAAKADADREFRIALKNASEVRTSAIRNQMFPGQGVVTSGRTGKKYSFGPQMGGPAASGGAMPSNVTDIPRDPSTGRLVVPGATPRSATPPPAARQTDEEFGPPAPVSPIVARQSATQGRPSPARQQIEALGPMTDETFRTALARFTPAERNDAYRTIRALTFKSLGLNPYSEQLRIGESRLFRNPDSYMLDLAQTPEFTTYWKSMDPEEKARILQAALIEADTGGAGRYSRFGIDLPSYGPAGSAQRFE